jgi:1-acyl-sn-glycerol-3-phosphate acyltransferase
VNQVVKQGRERLAAGMGVIVYPEGTRVAAGQTRKYGISGALLATQTGAPIVPIAHTSGYFWPRRSLLKKAGTIHLMIGPPIDPRGLEPREINERAQAWIEAAIAQAVARPGGKPD